MQKARLAKIDHARHCMGKDLTVKWKYGGFNIHGFQQSIWHSAKKKIKGYTRKWRTVEYRVYVWIEINRENIEEKEVISGI